MWMSLLLQSVGCPVCGARPGEVIRVLDTVADVRDGLWRHRAPKKPIGCTKGRRSPVVLPAYIVAEVFMWPLPAMLRLGDQFRLTSRTNSSSAISRQPSSLIPRDPKTGPSSDDTVG